MPMMVIGWSAGSSKMGIDVLREAAHRNMGHAEPLILLIFILWLSRFLIPWIPWMRGSGVKKMVRGKLQKTYKMIKKLLTCVINYELSFHLDYESIETFIKFELFALVFHLL